MAKTVESDSDSSSEEASSQESETQFIKNPSKPQQRPSSSSESGSESESDSDEPDPKLRFIATKPKEDPQKKYTDGTRSGSKPSATKSVKRPAEEKETEVTQKKAEPETSDAKKVLFQRLWSEEDEIVILKGMIDYSTKKKTKPLDDLNAFLDFIQKNLHIYPTKTQLQDKIRRLKKKYLNNRSREKKEGRERTFSNRHEQKSYELSKSIWRNENVKEEPKHAMAVDADIHSVLWRKRARAKSESDIDSVLCRKRARAKSILETFAERVLMVGAELFEEREGDDGRKQWNKLEMEEMEVYLRHLEVEMDEMEVYQRHLKVKTAKARLVIERLKSEGK